MSARLARLSRARNWRAAGMLAAPILTAALCLGTAGAQSPAPSQFKSEFEKQEKIYRSKGAGVPSGYITTRSLARYEETLPSGFSDALRKLGPANRWLDIGAGGGNAILDYHSPEYDAAQAGKSARPRGKAQAVALSIEDRRTDEWRQRAASIGGNRIRYLFGKRLREYSREELGKFQLITDVYGGFSYTESLSLFVEKVLDLLEINGGFYTMVQSVHLQDGKDKPSTWYLTELIDASGRDVTVCSWLKSVACVKVACESKSDWDTPTELIHVQKVCNAVRVPPLKALLYEAGNPPGRRFRLE